MIFLLSKAVSNDFKENRSINITNIIPGYILKINTDGSNMTEKRLAFRRF